MKPNHFGLITSSILFLTFIVLSLVFQSTTYLYIASVGPLLIVPFIPDIRSGQYIRPNQAKGAVRLITMENKDKSGSDFLVILFDQGFVKWDHKQLYFNLDDVMKDVYIKPDPFAATMTVLKYDLSLHRSKKGWVGISLAQLQQRMSQLSYTTNEINRIVIQLSDVHELLQKTVSQPAAAGRSVGA
jgi:hypothetical protein